MSGIKVDEREVAGAGSGRGAERERGAERGRSESPPRSEQPRSGGTVNAVDSVEGQDADVSASQGSGQGPSASSLTDARPLASWRGSGRVLVVDDEPSVARLTALVLDQYGFEVEVAISGQDALEQIARQPSVFRLVVVDLSMPDLSGVDVLNRARALGCPAPMVLTSGHSSTDTDSVLKSSAFAGYLQKPYRLETLLEVIQRALVPQS